MAKETFRNKKIRMFKSMSFYSEWEKEFKKQKNKDIINFMDTTKGEDLIDRAFDKVKSKKGELYWTTRSDIWATLISMVRKHNEQTNTLSLKEIMRDHKSKKTNKEMKEGYYESKAKLHYAPNSSSGGFGYGQIDRDPYFTS